METIGSLLKDGEPHQLILMGGVAILVLAATLETLGMSKALSAMAGRLHVKKLAASRRGSKDATLSHIFIYPGKFVRRERKRHIICSR